MHDGLFRVILNGFWAFYDVLGSIWSHFDLISGIDLTLSLEV